MPLPQGDPTRALAQLLSLMAAAIVIATLYFARVVFVPFALALLFAFLLTPAVRMFDRLRLPRAVSALIVVVVAVFALGTLSVLVAKQLVEVAVQLPEYRDTIQDKIDSLHTSKSQALNRAAAAVNEIGKQLAAAAPNGNGAIEPNAAANKKGPTPAKPMPVQVVPSAGGRFESLNGVVGPVTTFGIVIVFTLFILIRREDLRNRFIRLVGHGRLSVTTQALDDASQRVSRYLFMQLSVNIGFGAVVGIGLYFIGIPHALLWGAIGALLRFLPYIGGFLSAALPVLLAVAMFDGWTRPLLTIGLYAAAEIVVANLVEPMLYGANVGLSSLAVLVAAIFWTALWGPVGLVLSTPLTVCLVVIGRYVPDLEFLNVMLGDEPVLTPERHFYQRLLASDPQEARRVVDNYLKENSRQKLYDLVLIPTLTMALEDRQRNDLDESTEKFICLNTRELVEELSDRPEAARAEEQEAAGEGEERLRVPKVVRAELAKNVMCVPARDEADEIAALMLSQTLEHAGHKSQAVTAGPVADMATEVEKVKPDVVCVSALQPFAISHARNLYARLRRISPTPRILVVLWGLTGEVTQVAARLRLGTEDRILASLEQVLAEMNSAAGAAQSSLRSPETEEGGHPSAEARKDVGATADVRGR